MMPVVRGVMAASTLAGSRQCVAGSMSANTGVISCHCRACAVATKVNAGTMTSPVRPSALTRSSSPIVPLATRTQLRTPVNAAMRRSSSITYSPWLVSQRRSSMSFSRARKRSRSPMLGRPTCNCSANAGAAPNSASAGAGRADLSRCVAGRSQGRGQGAGFNAPTSSARLRFAISCSVIPAVRRPSSLNCFRVKGCLAHVSRETGSASPRIIRPITP